MNGKELYLAVGEIDDALVLEADEAPARHGLPAWRRWAPLAACLVLVLAAAFFARGREQVTFNDLGYVAVQIKVAGEMVSFTDEEAWDYYGVTLPDTLAGLPMADHFWARFVNDAGGTTYDANWVAYHAEGERRQVSVGLTTTGFFSPDYSGAKWSKLEGTEVLLSRFGSPEDYSYWARFSKGETLFEVVGAGMSQDEFLAVVRELVQR